MGQRWDRYKAFSKARIKRASDFLYDNLPEGSALGRGVREGRAQLKTEEERGQAHENLQAMIASRTKFEDDPHGVFMDNILFVILATLGFVIIISSFQPLVALGAVIVLGIMVYIAAPSKLTPAGQKLALVMVTIIVGLVALGYTSVPAGVEAGEVPAGLITMFSAVFFMAVFIGLTGGPEARPAIGVMIMVFAMFIFSFAYSDVVGASIFGAWWPQLEAAGEAIFGPLDQALGRGGCEMEATYKCITEGPAVCAQEKQKCNKRVAELAGTEEAIEFTEFRLVPSELAINGESTVVATVENRGDWDAKNVNLTLEPPKLQRLETGRPVEKVVGDVKNPSCKIQGKVSGNSCIWDLLPKYNKAKGIGGRGPAEFDVDWKDMRTAPEFKVDWTGVHTAVPCTPQNCDISMFPELTFVFSFDYDVRAAYSVDVRSGDELERILLSEGDIPLVQARYSGGPVMASLYAPKYLQANEQITMSASLTNTKEGTVKNASYCIYFPSAANGVAIMQRPTEQVGGIAGIGATTQDISAESCEPIGDLQAIKCGMGDLDSRKEVQKAQVKGDYSKRNSRECAFKIRVGIGAAKEKRLDVIGKATYKYEVREVKKVGPIVP